MTAKEFWNSQVPTDANKIYVSDFYATKFDHDDLARFAEAFANQEVEKRIAERMPSEEDVRNELCRHLYNWLENNAFKDGCNWLRSRLVSQKTEGGGE